MLILCGHNVCRFRFPVMQHAIINNAMPTSYFCWVPWLHNINRHKLQCSGNLSKVSYQSYSAISAILDAILDSLLCNLQSNNYESGFTGFFDPPNRVSKHQMHLCVMNMSEYINGLSSNSGHLRRHFGFFWWCNILIVMEMDWLDSLTHKTYV